MGSKCSKCLAKDAYSTNKSRSLIDLPSHIDNSLKDSILQLSSDDSFLTFDKILNKHPNNPEILISFASQLYEKGLIIQANECFKRLLEHGFQLSPKGSVIYAHILVQNKNYDIALKILIQSLDKNPNDHETHALLAGIYAELDMQEQSYKHISEAIKWNDNVAEYQNSYGLCMMKKKKYNDALKHFLRAYDLDCNMAKALNNAGNAYRKLGSTVEAIKCYNLAINLIPKRKFPIALINLATACFYTGDILSTLQYFEEALQTGCNIHKIMVKKGYHLLFKNPKTKFAIELVYKQEYRKSIVLFNEILQNDPYNAIVNYYMAIALSEIGKNSEANNYYKATIE
jgi:tetratricopeptide (TPR) repeat protein